MGGGDGSEPACPACKQVLKSISLSGVSVRGCNQCQGVLLARSDLIRTLEAATSEMIKGFDPDTKLDAIPDRPGRIPCPSCGRPMAHDDYCAAGVAHFDRCEGCGLLWLGADELGAMALMWARMEGRMERSHKATQAALDEADDFVHYAGRARRMISRILK